MIHNITTIRESLDRMESDDDDDDDDNKNECDD